MDEPRGRRLIATTVLGSGMGFLDGTIANVALPHIGSDLHASFAELQWVINGYTLTLASLILVGGSLGDRFGRKRVYGWGIAGFAVASALAALSPTVGVLIAARSIQGIFAAMMTPGSLAMLQSSFEEDDRMRAIGAWTGTLGIATAAGPALGGWLVGIDWRIAFWINLPIAAIVLLLLRAAPESRDPNASKTFDLPAMILTPLALGSLTWSLTAWPATGAKPSTVIPLVVAALSVVAFVVLERRTPDPLVPLHLFRNRNFSVINVVTLFVYAALSGLLLFLSLFLQVTAGWTALAAGASTVPLSVVMFFLASRFGALSSKIGVKRPMLAGQAAVAVGLALLALSPRHPSYVLDILPGVIVMGLGLSMMVAPLTGAVLAAAPERYAGLASGINNAVSRTAGLLAVAGLPLLVGLAGTQYRSATAVGSAYRESLWWCAAGVALAFVITAVGVASGRSHPR
ncbi:MFS transporter [Nocardioides baekrokdamisoli]|uniref:MFS transporter n=1 Tax=Nocardioides baekrokdamisoli TaxID=1804624 RepID=A0A3G9IWV3_9ACTN|nr:MFS transporter [Nocardioides baekrokdamisoli]BBH15728.1 MFS transporter [Nocardioides baekrokdamisoli]